MKKKLALLAAILTLAPASALACACGCGVFEVATGSMLPTHTGGMALLEYDFMDQTMNWSGTSRAPDANNNDKEVRSHFLVAGAEYMFNRQWGAEVSVPYTQRYFATTDSGPLETFDHGSIGDIRLKGIYTGFSGDMSTGLTFGVKLPTGNFKQEGFDRDVQIGSGSTDLLLGGYHMGRISRGAPWNWFTSAELDLPVSVQEDYRPGSEINANIGLYYDGWVVGENTKIAPLARIIGSYRLHDSGAASDPDNTGYERVLLAPGVEIDSGLYKLYGDVEFSLYQHVNGNQIVAPVFFKLTASRAF